MEKPSEPGGETSRQKDPQEESTESNSRSEKTMGTVTTNVKITISKKCLEKTRIMKKYIESRLTRKIQNELQKKRGFLRVLARFRKYPQLFEYHRKRKGRGQTGRLIRIFFSIELLLADGIERNCQQKTSFLLR